ncbi:EamA family transporter [Roseomonas sp. HJA6]|uniref:EamA family transporter n=1 Tax=Roseomonas alba TaxID=2846776 RepID=A0ABS7AAZ2_9PROT|nr:EamA family transporter [Neoroseomonas alba]MBW6398480.1 EamA family transporter [Neoroseomonas alba]
MSSATLAGCGALLLWAFLALLARMAAGLPPLELTALGFAVGGALALAVVAARGRLALLRQGPLAWAHGVGGLFGYHALYFLALALAPAVEANLLNYLWPLLIVLLSAPLLGLHLGARRLVGVALGFSGCVLLVGAGASFPPGATPGFAAAIGCALVWAVYSVTSKRMAAVPTEALAGFCLATALLAGVAHLLFETTILPDGRQWIAVLLLGAGPLGAAFFLWDAGMKRGDPRLLGTLAYAVPVASTLLLVVAGEGVLSWRAAVAAVLVAGGGMLAATARS